MLDIHSHILACIDDGAKDLEESVNLLKMMKNDGITHVIATPHFYPQDTSLEEFLSTAELSYKKLVSKIKGLDLPKIYLGCEMLYFDGLGNSDSIYDLCLNKSEFLLLELTDYSINDRLFSNIQSLTQKTGIMPIIAHIERYCKAKNYKKLIDFVAENNIPVQLNASSFFISVFKRPLKKLIKSNVITILGTDAHSTDLRPPKMQEALEFIGEKYGSEYREKIIYNTEFFYNKIIAKAENL